MIRKLLPALTILCIISAQSVVSQPYKNDSLLKVIETGKKGTDWLYAHVLLASNLIPNEIDSAFVLLQKASKLANSTNPVHQADFLNTMGVYYWYSGEYDSAIEQFVRITKLKESLEMYMRLARAFNNAGALFNRSGEYDSAHIYLNESLRIDQLRNNEPGIAKTYYDLSTLNYRQGRFELSLKYQLASVKINESMNDSMRLIYGYNVLGNLFDKLNDTENAKTYYLKALELSDALPQYRQKSIILNNLSAMFCDTPEMFDVVMAYVTEGLKAADIEGKEEMKGALYVNLGGAYDANGNYREAYNYYHKARQYLEKEKSTPLPVELYLSLADLHLNLNNPDSALYYAGKARTTTGASGSLEKHSRAFLIMSKADSIKGDFVSALARYQEGIALRDSVWNNDNRNRIAELQIIYETDKKASENLLLLEQNELKSRIIRNQWYLIAAISLLVILIVVLLISEWRAKQKILAQKKEIDRKNEALTELNKTKDKFFKIIAHDLKGPISALAALLELADSEFDNMDDAQKAKIIHTLKQSSSNTYALLENLLDWSQAQTGKIVNKPEKFILSDAISEVFRFLEARANLKNQRLINEIPGNTFVFADKQLVKNVLINLVNNAIKFSRDHTAIRVTTSRNGSMQHISITDQGIGIPSDRIDRLFRIDSGLKRSGTHDEPGTGLGLIMVAEYLQIIGGSIEATSRAGQGSTFTFTVPAG